MMTVSRFTWAVTAALALFFLALMVGGQRPTAAAPDALPSGDVTLTPQAYLPIVYENFCGPFFDNFSDPNSGWVTGEDDFVRVAYEGDEYSVLAKNTNYFYLFRAPACSRAAFDAALDARWNGQSGDSYGLVFGIQGAFDDYYIFDMNSDLQLFRLLHRTATGFTEIVPITGSGAINTGAATNNLRARLDGGTLTLFINGVQVAQAGGINLGGPSDFGLMVAPAPTHSAEARFDNYSVTALTNGPAGGALSAPVATRWAREAAPTTLDWSRP